MTAQPAASTAIPAAVGTAAGVAVSIALPSSHKLLAAGTALLAAGCAIIGFGVVAYILDDGDLRTALARLRQAARLRRPVRQHAT